MEPWRTILLALTIVGFLFTVAGLAAAYQGAKREHKAAGDRIVLLRELSDREQAARAKAKDDADVNETYEALNEEYEGIYAEHDLVRPTYDNMVYLAQHESQRLLGMVLDETRRDFLVAGAGLLVSTIASVGSLYLSAS
jgi:hypothetical protein